jgi:hypothetical protein
MVGMPHQLRVQPPAKGCRFPVLHGFHDGADVANQVKYANLAFQRCRRGGLGNDAHDQGEGYEQSAHGICPVVV